jgi:hypothetical protein
MERVRILEEHSESEMTAREMQGERITACETRLKAAISNTRRGVVQ